MKEMDKSNMSLCNYKNQDKIKNKMVATRYLAYKMAYSTLQKELDLLECIIIVFTTLNYFRISAANRIIEML